MGLFDKFRKKKKSEDSISNLEELIEKAAKEPAYRTEFYKRLLTEELVVMTESTGLPNGKFVANEDTKANIRSFKDGQIPVFTSTERIFDNKVIKGEVVFLKFQADVLFKMLSGKTLLLNPYSDYGKELLPNEIDRLLDGTFFTDGVKPVEIKANTAFAIGQPTKYPTEIVKSLTELFSNRSNVYAAYLGWIQNSSTDEPPHYIFAIDAIGDWDSLIQEAGFIAKQILGKEEIVDFIKFDSNNSFCDYFIQKTTPFYKK